LLSGRPTLLQLPLRLPCLLLLLRLLPRHSSQLLQLLLYQQHLLIALLSTGACIGVLSQQLLHCTTHCRAEPICWQRLEVASPNFLEDVIQIGTLHLQDSAVAANIKHFIQQT
jgi:hypothetical protein